MAIVSMMYRACITNIVDFVSSRYDLDVFHVVKSSSDVYLEVHSENEATLLESINDSVGRWLCFTEAYPF